MSEEIPPIQSHETVSQYYGRILAILVGKVANLEDELKQLTEARKASDP